MANQINWVLDQAHSVITFKIRHLMIANVTGAFKVFDVNIYTTGKDFSTAEIDIWIDSSSVTTGDANRDEHIRSSDFLDVDRFKQITFVSNSISGQEDVQHRYELWGKLTIKGLTRNIKLQVLFGGISIDLNGNEKAGFTVTGDISRSDWGLTWNKLLEAGGAIVADTVSVSCEIELINKGQKELTMKLAPTDYAVKL